MAKESSFDIVSNLDLQEVDNSVNQAKKEVVNRYDLKSTKSEIALDKEGLRITITTENDMALRAVVDILQSKMVKRSISLKALDLGKVRPAAAGRVSQDIALVSGISADKAREINQLIKNSKIKVRSQVEGDKLRIVAKSKDLLQETIALIKEADVDIPLQFVNFR